MNRRDLLKSVVAAATAAARAQNPAWKPVLFDAHQNDTVIALTDLIVPATDTPGAKAAQVNRFLDLLLSESPIDQQSRFLQGLAWLDAYARRSHGVPFVQCTAPQQTALLQSLDSEGDGPGARFFQDLKRRTVSGYYSSKIGVDELNKGGRVPSTYGCTHPGHLE